MKKLLFIISLFFSPLFVQAQTIQYDSSMGQKAYVNCTITYGGFTTPAKLSFSVTDACDSADGATISVGIYPPADTNPQPVKTFSIPMQNSLYNLYITNRCEYGLVWVFGFIPQAAATQGYTITLLP